MDFPAASQELDHIALFPLIFIWFFVDDNSISNREASTSIFSFSLKRLAVSFTTANASGKISSR